MNTKHTPSPWTIDIPFAGFSAIRGGKNQNVIFGLAWNDHDEEYVAEFRPPGK